MQRAPASDQELNLKKRARRRLVGAIALVLLMVIVLPMILKDRAATLPQEQVTITLPNEQAQPEASDFDSSIVPTDPPVTLTPEVVEPASEVAAPDPEATLAKEVPVKAPEVAKPSTEKLASGKFYVQIGVFSDAANVKQLQSKLSDLGYKSQTEKINTDKGTKIRLKTQIFGDRNDAAIALENIKDAGLTGMVVSQ
jgi:DedD protein